MCERINLRVQALTHLSPLPVLEIELLVVVHFGETFSNLHEMRRGRLDSS